MRMCLLRRHGRNGGFRLAHTLEREVAGVRWKKPARQDLTHETVLPDAVSCTAACGGCRTGSRRLFVVERGRLLHSRSQPFATVTFTLRKCLSLWQ